MSQPAKKLNLDSHGMILPPHLDPNAYKLRKKLFNILTISVLVSVFFHLATFIQLDYISSSLKNYSSHTSVPITLKLPQKTQSQPSKNQTEKQRKIVEVQQTETEAPDQADYNSFQNHKTDKQTKTDLKNNDQLAEAKQQSKVHRKSIDQAHQATQKSASSSTLPSIKSTDGSLSFNRQPENEYQKLLPTQDFTRKYAESGYQAYIDDDLLLGDAIDINTRDYRYMSYFSSIRKAIALVWTYPSEAARRGMDGRVDVSFIIEKDGKIRALKIVQSSGFSILDDAVLEALRLASPLDPLPPAMGKERLPVTWGFQYTLSRYASY